MLSLMPLTCESDVPLTLFLTVSAYVPVLGIPYSATPSPTPSAPKHPS